MNANNSIDVLNKLIEINNDRVAGYETASGETKEADLQSLFRELTATSQTNLTELRAEVNRLGGKAEEGTMLSGKIYRAWMDAKAALTGGDRGGILSSCEYGEDMALDTYNHVLEEHTNVLSSDQLELVRKQQANLRADHDRVRALRDEALA